MRETCGKEFSTYSMLLKGAPGGAPENQKRPSIAHESDRERR
jgi:hypothetical protein